MKKKVVAVFAAMLAAVLLLAGCGLYIYEFDDRFPYDVAVSRGEDGSEASWLASQSTPSTEFLRAYEEAKADGSFSGTYFEFLESLGLSGDNGAYVQRALLSAVSIFCLFEPSNRRDESFYSAGSGVIYSIDTEKGDAFIVTNYHVVYSADSRGNEKVSHISDEISLYLYGGETTNGAISATYYGGAMQYDIAVLKVENEPKFKAENGEVYVREVIGANSDCICVGERVYAIGNADGVGMSVTEGIVSVDAEYIDIYAANEKDELSLLEIRTDAAVNHGNSGGGLFNSLGELVGIVNARDESDGLVGFGYAIPSNLALSLAQNIIDTCAASPAARGAAAARIGITVEVQDSRAVYDSVTGRVFIEEKLGVSDVESGTAGKTAGIEKGDTLVEAKLISSRGTVTVATTRLYKLTNLLFEVRFGDTLELTVSRNSKTVVISIVFDDNAYFRMLR